jgi:hypothetical protein
MNNLFQPRHEPAKTIYNALIKEATYRQQKSCDEWIIAERNVVYQTAVRYAQHNHLRIPTMEEVVSAETSACGHVDYAMKFAIQVADLLNETPKTPHQ